MSLLLRAIVQLLGALSVMVAIATVIVGGFLLLVGLSDGGGGFLLQGVGMLDGLAVLAVGNLVCLLLHVGILVLRRWHWELDWLRNLVVRVQLVPAILSVVVAVLYAGLAWRNETVSLASRAIEAGLADGQAQAVEAYKRCTGRCLRDLDADHQLLLAAQYDRIDWARLVARRGGRIASMDYTPAQRREPVLCERDVVVQYANALELAVIHDNPALIDLLLPLTEQPFKEHALYTAVVLGREDAVQRLLASFGWTTLPKGLERLSRRPDGRAQLIVPDRPLACELSSWAQRGFPPDGR